jgi:hypothetical protein
MIKQSDIAIIILVISISLVASFFLGDALINTNENRSAEVEVVTPISNQFSQPDFAIFNNESINPTELIQIGQTNTKDPFANTNN